MQATELMLYAIIRKRNYELLKIDLIDYFPHQSAEKKILEGCFFIKMRGGTIEPNIIKNWVSQNYKDKEKTFILDKLTNVIQGDKYTDVYEIERQVEIEFYDRRWSEINKMLVNSHATLEMKKDLISKTNEIINRTKKVDDFVSIKKILNESHSLKLDGKESKLYKKSIILEDTKLINIFGKNIYPMMHSILARPNSYKTTLLYNIILEFSKLKKTGIIASLEDTAEMASIKIMAILSGLNKVELITGKYNVDDFEKHLKTLPNNIFVMDKIRTPNELYIDLKNKLMVKEIDYIAVDFLQGIKRERYQADTEKIEQLVEVLFELNKEFMIPVFQLSQAPKQNVQNKKENLGMGMEKGSSVISEKSRWSCSINPSSYPNDKGNPYEILMINVYKTTLSPKGEIKINFHKKSGQIESTQRLDY